MKLKKIASLALAGIMAVSMLAGCSNNGGSNNGDGNVNADTNTSSVVSAVNNGQSATNSVKVTFTSNASLDAALKKAVELYGDNSANVISDPTSQNTFKNAVLNLTGLKENMPTNYDSSRLNSLGFFSKTNSWIDPDKNPTKVLDGKVFTEIYVGAFPALSEQAALNLVADHVDNMVAQLDTTTYDKDTTMAGDKYYDYSYAGTISLVSAQNSTGATVYYYACTISQTVTQKTWEK